MTRSSNSGSTTTMAAQLGAFSYWPDNPFWSFQLVRLIEQANAGGADFAECHSVAKRLTEGDGEAWHAGFKGLAEEVEQKATAAAAGGHRVTAREAFLRASNYHRAAGFFLSPGDGRHGEAVLARRRCFTAAAELSDAPIEAVEIPYEGTSLPGYRFGPAGSARPGAAAIIFGGTDAVAEEMYFFLGRALADRGFTTVAIDGPGQGEALRRGITARPDYEVAVAAVINFLESDPDVDPQRIGLVGQSLGGYYAARAAAFAPRLQACVVWGALYDLREVLGQHVDGGGPTADHFIEQYKIILGAPDAEAIFETLEAFNLQGIAERIACPTLIVHGEDDMLIPLGDAHRTFAEIPAADKKLIVYPSGEPGCTHCQVDALGLVQSDICDWLERHLVPGLVGDTSHQ